MIILLINDVKIWGKMIGNDNSILSSLLMVTKRWQKEVETYAKAKMNNFEHFLEQYEYIPDY